MLRKRLSIFMASAVIAITGVVGMSPKVGATDWSINMSQACAYFTNVGWSWASPSNANDVYSWKCSTVPYPFWMQWGGNLDLNLWCAYSHPGSSAGFYDRYNAYTWYCRG